MAVQQIWSSPMSASSVDRRSYVEGVVRERAFLEIHGRGSEIWQWGRFKTGFVFEGVTNYCSGCYPGYPTGSSTPPSYVRAETGQGSMSQLTASKLFLASRLVGRSRMDTHA